MVYRAISDRVYNSLPGIILATAFVTHLFVTTKYTINDNVLRVQSSFIINKTVVIKDIKKIKETYNPLSAPAASIDRLQVYYGDGSSVLISSKDKKGFVAHLQIINPGIVYQPRKKW